MLAYHAITWGLNSDRTLQGDRVLEGHGVSLGESRDLDVGLAVDCDSEGFVCLEPGVECCEGRHVLDLDRLADVDGLLLDGLGLGEVDSHKGGVRLQVLEVHDSLEALNRGLDLAVRFQSRVDGHGV